MSIIQKTTLKNNSKLGLWKLCEDLNSLEAVFPFLPEEEKYYNALKNINRKREWLTTRILLTELLQQRKLIKYTEHGKPYIENSNWQLSISHSKNHVALILSNKFTPGIDIEHFGDRVLKVKNKFLNNNELKWCNTIQLMTTCWSAKETIFKIYEKELDFHDIIIDEFNTDDSYLMATTIKNKKDKRFKVYFEQVENNVLTYTFQLI